MSDKPDQSKSKADPAVVWELIEQTSLARAADLARAGKYKEAEAVINEAMHSGKATPVLLDLLAKIHAQQGNWDQAEAAWKVAHQLDPQNEAYAASLQRVTQSRRFHPPLLWFWGIGALALIALVAVGILLLVNSSRPATPMPIIITATPAALVMPTSTQALPTAESTSVPSSTPLAATALGQQTCTIDIGFTGATINLRTGPNINFPSVGWLYQGDKVELLGGSTVQNVAGWIYVSKSAQLQGWINASYCK